MDRTLFEITTEGDFGKTPGTPFGWMFWTLLIYIKIFLMWGQAVTVKVFLPYLKMSLYYRSTQINECFLKFSGTEVQIQFLGQFLDSILDSFWDNVWDSVWNNVRDNLWDNFLDNFLGQFFRTIFWTIFGTIVGTMLVNFWIKKF